MMIYIIFIFQQTDILIFNVKYAIKREKIVFKRKKNSFEREKENNIIYQNMLQKWYFPFCFRAGVLNFIKKEKIKQK